MAIEDASAPPDQAAAALLWHVTVTVSGPPVPVAEIRAGLERLADEHPFLLAGRYASDRAEVRYWEEAADAWVITDLALRLWEEHRGSAGLPQWRVVGVEVIDRETFRRRGLVVAPALAAAGALAPF